MAFCFIVSQYCGGINCINLMHRFHGIDFRPFSITVDTILLNSLALFLHEFFDVNP